MNRPTLLGSVLAATLAVAAALSIPKPAHALLCCDGATYGTSQWWASGPTCADAQAAYRALSLPEAQADCGGATQVCAFTIPPCEDNSAYDPANPWRVDGVAFYGCKYECSTPYLSCEIYNGKACVKKGNRFACEWGTGALGQCACQTNLVWLCV